MDPISTAILAALAAGATAGLTEAAKKVIGEAYEALKTGLKARFGADNKLSRAVANLEEDKESKASQELVKEKAAALQADQDRDLLALAKAVTDAIQQHTGAPASALVMGSGILVQGNDNQVVGAGGVMVGGGVQGDVVTGTKIAQQAGDNAIQVGQGRDVTIGRKD